MAIIPPPSSPRRPSTDQQDTFSQTSPTSEHVVEDFGDVPVGPPPCRPGIEEHMLHFILNRQTPQEQVVDFKCTTSNAFVTLKSPPANASIERAAGDIHVHVFMGGVQLWVFDNSKWAVGREGDPHPILGRNRVLFHREPRNSALPNWVLPATLVTYQSRKRQDLM